jgi:glutamyl-tRNA(Gln) amidotransferase subunit E
MYPETDILPIVIDEQKINLISKELPKSVSEREEYYKKLGLSVNHIEEMKLNNFARFFEECVEEKTNPVTTATTLLQTITELKRKGISFEKKYFSELKEILKAEALGKINKKNIPEALEEIVSGKTASQIIEEQSKFANTTSDVEITGELKKIIEKNSELVLKKTMGAIGPLMGDVMKNEKLRGVDGKKISEILKKEIILFVEKHQHA